MFEQKIQSKQKKYKTYIGLYSEPKLGIFDVPSFGFFEGLLKPWGWMSFKNSIDREMCQLLASMLEEDGHVTHEWVMFYVDGYLESVKRNLGYEINLDSEVAFFVNHGKKGYYWILRNDQKYEKFLVKDLVVDDDAV